MSDKIKVQVEGPVRESTTSYNVFVDLYFNEEGRCTGASRREWFPKTLCDIEKLELFDSIKYYLIAPKWLLDKKKVKYEKDK